MFLTGRQSVYDDNDDNDTDDDDDLEGGGYTQETDSFVSCKSCFPYRGIVSPSLFISKDIVIKLALL